MRAGAGKGNRGLILKELHVHTNTFQSPRSHLVPLLAVTSCSGQWQLITALIAVQELTNVCLNWRGAGEGAGGIYLKRTTTYQHISIPKSHLVPLLAVTSCSGQWRVITALITVQQLTHICLNMRGGQVRGAGGLS